jgi:hypothetical protein
MGFWWHVPGNKYLQLEEGKLCFKVETSDKARRFPEWSAWHEAVLLAARGRRLGVSPARRRLGTWMTVALMDGDYCRTNEQGLVDLERTVEVLRQAEGLLEAATARRAPTS